VTFPAVPYHAGVLRIQVNANHLPESIDGLLRAMESMEKIIPLPRSPNTPRRAA
jgi:glycine C-acetyltransferase